MSHWKTRMVMLGRVKLLSIKGILRTSNCQDNRICCRVVVPRRTIWTLRTIRCRIRLGICIWMEGPPKCTMIIFHSRRKMRIWCLCRSRSRSSRCFRFSRPSCSVPKLQRTPTQTTSTWTQSMTKYSRTTVDKSRKDTTPSKWPNSSTKSNLAPSPNRPSALLPSRATNLTCNFSKCNF